MSLATEYTPKLLHLVAQLEAARGRYLQKVTVQLRSSLNTVLPELPRLAAAGTGYGNAANTTALQTPASKHREVSCATKVVPD